jgi:hypothetical protein
MNPKNVFAAFVAILIVVNIIFILFIKLNLSFYTLPLIIYCM